MMIRWGIALAATLGFGLVACSSNGPRAGDRCGLYDWSFKGPERYRPLFQTIADAVSTARSHFPVAHSNLCNAEIEIDQEKNSTIVKATLREGEKPPVFISATPLTPDVHPFYYLTEKVAGDILFGPDPDRLIAFAAKDSCKSLPKDFTGSLSGLGRKAFYSSRINGENVSSCDTLCSSLISTGLLKQVAFQSRPNDWTLSKLAHGNERGQRLREDVESLAFEGILDTSGNYLASVGKFGGLSFTKELNPSTEPAITLNTIRIGGGRYRAVRWNVEIQDAGSNLRYRRSNVVVIDRSRENSDRSSVVFDCRGSGGSAELVLASDVLSPLERAARIKRQAERRLNHSHVD